MARKAGSSGEKTVKELKKVAMALFASQGYAAVSMRQIASEVGIQAGAIYNYFPTKQDILATLMKSHMLALLETWRTVEKALETPEDALEAFVRFHIRYHVGRADEVFISYMELRNLERQNFLEIEKLRNEYEQILQKIISEGVASGAFKVSDAHVAAMAIIAMLTGVTNWYREDGRLSLSEVETLYADMSKRAVGMV